MRWDSRRNSWRSARVYPSFTSATSSSEEEHQQRVEYSQKISQGIIPESILSRIDQQKVQARDEYDRRWVKCEICGKIAPDSEFNSYGGPNHINLGRCNDCTRQKK